VLIDLPKDVQVASLKFQYPDKVELRGYKPTYAGNPRQIEKANQDDPEREKTGQSTLAVVQPLPTAVTI